MKRYIISISLLLISLCMVGEGRKVSFYNRGKISLKGDTQTNAPVSLYIKGSYQGEGSSVIRQTGKSVLTGNFINNVTTGNVFSDRSGSIEFRGADAQYIFGTADKGSNYINFPQTVIINNQNTNKPDSAAVIIDPRMGASVKNLKITRGRLVLDSRVNGIRQSDVAHLLVEKEGSIQYNRENNLPREQQGIIQVNLALGNNYNEKRLIGFTPPFQKIYADYFMFNFLSQPTNTGLFGDAHSLITDPRSAMTAGTGYIVGQGLVPNGDPYYIEELDPEFVAASYDDRAKEKLSFGRSFAPASITQFVSASDRFTGEILCIDDVAVQLRKGFNYIGNPFTVPLDMTGFVEETATPDDWGVTRSADGSGDVRNSFYVISQGTGSYHPESSFARFRFNVSYLLGQSTGGTLTYEGGYSSLQIAPMQLFVVGRDAGSSKEMKIPASARKHANARFLRSGNAATDELLIETKDNHSGGYDRLCVVFRENASEMANDPYDAGKIFNSSGGVNQIYTKSSDNKMMTTNVIAPTQESLVMFFQPSAQAQEVTLSAHRINTLSSVKKIVLEDTETGAKTNLLQTPNYSFMSSPTDKHDRFVLYFDTRSSEGISEEIDDNNDVSIYYNAGTLVIQGLKERHIGFSASVFSMNGQLLHSAHIKETPIEQLDANLSQGMYVVRLSGEKATITKKLLVK